MKELSIEEKAKAYDKLLGKAKQIYNKENDVLIIHTLEDLFPELKESEDERIRRELINYFIKGKEHLSLCSFSKEKILTWLEKQAEQKLPIEKLPSEMKTIGESLGFTTQEECDEYNQMVSNLIMSDDDKSEQKPDTDFADLRTWKYIVDAVWTEKEGIGQYLDSPFTEEVAKKLQKRFGNIGKKQYDIDVLEKHITKDSISELAHTVIIRNGWEIVDTKEQKPWSEEDKHKFISVTNLIDGVKYAMMEKDPLRQWCSPEYCQELRDWFTSLKSRVKCADVSQQQDIMEALRTEYEKGRADIIADTLSWLANVWPQYCDNPNIIEGFKEAIKRE